MADSKQPRNPFWLFPKLKLTLQWPSPEKPVGEEVVQTIAEEFTEEEDIAGESPKPMMARFPNAQQVALPSPLAVKNEMEPFVSLPGVYLLAGYLVLRWVFARWSERKRSNQRPASSDDNTAE